MGILARILDVIFPPKDTTRIVRDLSSESFGTLLSPVVTPSGVVALLPYCHGTVRAAIIEAKFKKNPKAIALLASILRDYLDSLTEESEELEPTTYQVIPVPLARGRHNERGYNQVEEVARVAEAQLAPGLLSRTRETKAQTSLSRKERLTNMEGAFVVSGALIPSVTYILLDDVVTTGATLAAAKEALSGDTTSTILSVALAH